MKLDGLGQCTENCEKEGDFCHEQLLIHSDTFNATDVLISYIAIKGELDQKGVGYIFTEDLYGELDEFLLIAQRYQTNVVLVQANHLYGYWRFHEVFYEVIGVCAYCRRSRGRWSRGF